MSEFSVHIREHDASREHSATGRVDGNGDALALLRAGTQILQFLSNRSAAPVGTRGSIPGVKLVEAVCRRAVEISRAGDKERTGAQYCIRNPPGPSPPVFEPALLAQAHMYCHLLAGF